MSLALKNIATELTQHEPKCGSVRVITIDGPAGSGKTTLASALSMTLGQCPIVTMDDVYEGWDLGLSDQTFQRVIEQVLLPLREHGTARYEKFDWHQKKFNSWIAIPPSKFLILDGVGSGHPLLRSFVNLSLWVEADVDLLLNRVLNRDGQEIREEMLRWQQHEKQFFNRHKIRESADYIFSTS